MKKSTRMIAGSILAALVLGAVAVLAVPSLTYDLRARLGVLAFNHWLDELAAFLVRRPAEIGHAPSLNHLAVLHFDGLGGVARDRAKTIAFLKRAADLGYAPAQANLGFLYWYGVGRRLKRDRGAARSLYETATSQDDVIGLMRLADAIRSTDRRNARFKVTDLLRRAAEQDDPDALFEFATHLKSKCNRLPPEINCMRELIAAYRRAAAQDHGAAKYELADYLQRTATLSRTVGALRRTAARERRAELAALHDPTEYMRLMEGAAGAGNIWAMETLAEHYFNGDGVASDRRKAAHWFERVAAYERQGRSVAPPRRHESLYLRPYRSLWLRDTGYRWKKARAMSKLGEIYADGIDVETDYEKAAFYHRRAAEQDIEESAVSLARLYLSGHGLPRSQHEAVYWLRQAERAGSAEAVSILNTLGEPRN